MPAGWQIRWHVLYGDLVTFRRLFRANRRDDAPDVLTGIIETESETASRKISGPSDSAGNDRRVGTTAGSYADTESPRPPHRMFRKRRIAEH